MSDFHLLRPEWLLALIPLLFATIFNKRKKKLSGQWKNIIAPQLQDFVLKETKQTFKTSNVLLSGLWLATLLGILAFRF